MDIRSLITFIQVAELNSFTKAAEKLGYSQPTVSFQIKQLESELETQLFERIGHTVTLTDDGHKIMEYAQTICRTADEMMTRSHPSDSPSGTVRLALADSLCAPFALEQFAKFRKAYPDISVIMISAGTDEMFRMLDHNEVDIVCTLDNHIYNTTYVISNEEKIGVHFVCSPENALSKKANGKKLSVKELLGESFLLTEKGMSYRRLLDEYMAKHSIELSPALQLGNADILCRLAEENTGISFLPDYVTENAVRAGRLVRLEVEGLEIEIWKQILYHCDKWVSAPMRAVIDFLGEVVLGENNREIINI